MASDGFSERRTTLSMATGAKSSARAGERRTNQFIAGYGSANRHRIGEDRGVHGWRRQNTNGTGCSGLMYHCFHRNARIPNSAECSGAFGNASGRGSQGPGTHYLGVLA
jgi:hypothetical protein